MVAVDVESGVRQVWQCYAVQAAHLNPSLHLLHCSITILGPAQEGQAARIRVSVRGHSLIQRCNALLVQVNKSHLLQDILKLIGAQLPRPHTRRSCDTWKQYRLEEMVMGKEQHRRDEGGKEQHRRDEVGKEQHRRNEGGKEQHRRDEGGQEQHRRDEGGGKHYRRGGMEWGKKQSGPGGKEGGKQQCRPREMEGGRKQYQLGEMKHGREQHMPGGVRIGTQTPALAPCGSWQPAGEASPLHLPQ